MAGWLREDGHQADHVLEIGLAQSKDRVIWLYAQEHRAVIVTKDEDFAEWVRRGRPGPAVLWLRTWLEPLLPAIISQLEKGERLVEAR